MGYRSGAEQVQMRILGTIDMAPHDGEVDYRDVFGSETSHPESPTTGHPPNRNYENPTSGEAHNCQKQGTHKERHHHQKNALENSVMRNERSKKKLC